MSAVPSTIPPSSGASGSWWYDHAYHRGGFITKCNLLIMEGTVMALMVVGNTLLLEVAWV